MAATAAAGPKHKQAQRGHRCEQQVDRIGMIDDQADVGFGVIKDAGVLDAGNANGFIEAAKTRQWDREPKLRMLA